MISPEALFLVFGFYDKSRFHLVDGRQREIICQHPYPSSIDANVVIMSVPSGNADYVRLKAIANGSRATEFGGREPNVIGYAGQCPKCGKVYHT